MNDNVKSRDIASRRLASPPTHVKPGFAMLSGESLYARFERELLSKGAEVIEVSGLTALSEAVARVLAPLALDISELAVSDDPAFVDAGLGPGARRDADARAALTHAVSGVAETGTLVLASGPENPTTLVFLPDVHIVALAKEDLYPNYEAALGALLKSRGAFPRAVNLVSGPSRTGDIGGRIVLGAHGPRHLAVIVYGRAQEKCP